MPMLYFEQQVANLCGQHCLNNLLQAAVFTEDQLASIALELDAKERQLMMSQGNTADARAFLASPALGGFKRSAAGGRRGHRA